MIRVQGRDWGTAAEIAHELGGDVTEAMVRNWVRRDGLRTVRVGRTAYHDLVEAAEIEARKRASGRGRPRPLDAVAAATA